MRPPFTHYLALPIASTATYSYDAVGNMTQAGDGSGTVGFTYDALNRTTTVTSEDATTTGYSYDANGKRLSVTYPDGRPVTTAYDLLSWVTSLTDHDGSSRPRSISANCLFCFAPPLMSRMGNEASHLSDYVSLSPCSSPYRRPALPLRASACVVCGVRLRPG